MMLETFLFIFGDSTCSRNGKESERKHGAKKLEMLYILLLPLFYKCCFLCSFEPKHLLQPVLREAFEKAGK